MVFPIVGDNWPRAILLSGKRVFGMALGTYLCGSVAVEVAVLLAACERGFIAQIGLYLFEAAAFGLGHQGLDEDEGEHPDHGVA